MGDPRGFLKIGRKPPPERNKAERVQDYRHVHEQLPEDELKDKAARCMACGVPLEETSSRTGTI